MKKVVVITGGCGLLGRSLVKKFFEDGAQVVLIDINLKSIEKIFSKKIINSENVIFFKCNIKSAKDIKKILIKIIKTFSRVDILINNARPKLKLNSFPNSLSEWDLSIDILLKSPAVLSSLFLSELIKSKGTIINISSTNSRYISHQPLPYHVAKAGLEHLTRALAYELGPKGIRVNAISPGIIVGEKQNIKNLKFKKNILSSISPLKREVMTAEICDVALYLASDKATAINGQCIIVDGGISLGDHFNSVHKALSLN